MRKILAAALLLGTSAAALAQSASPGSPTGSSTVTLGTGANTIGSIGNTAFGITGALPAGTNAIGSITNTAFGITGALPAGTNALGSVTPTAVGVTTTNGSTTVTTGGTFQTALASSAARKGCFVQNPFTATETLFVYFGSGTASTANSIGLAPGGVTTCAISGAYVATDAVQITAATTGHAFVLNSQ